MDTALIEAAGKISELWRYPVKSMLGEKRESLVVDSRGVEGDRLYAIHDANGKIGSGKNTRRFRRFEGLFGYAAAYIDGVPRITFPNGKVFGVGSSEADSGLSDAFGEKLTLSKESAVSQLDAGPVHLISQAALRWLSALLAGPVDSRRFRPNIVIDVPGDTRVERGWIGHRLRLGDEVEIRVCAETERCAMIAFAQSELGAAPDILRRIAKEANTRFGVYAEVLVPGVIRTGDSVSLMGKPGERVQ
jgi:uncharacterized protein YcbX